MWALLEYNNKSENLHWYKISHFFEEIPSSIVNAYIRDAPIMIFANIQITSI